MERQSNSLAAVAGSGGRIKMEPHVVRHSSAMQTGKGGGDGQSPSDSWVSHTHNLYIETRTQTHKPIYGH